MKQDLMFAVFLITLQTDKGKAIACDHQCMHNAQKVYQKVKTHYLKSTGAVIASSKKIECAIMACLNTSTWNSTILSFLLHWQEQICCYHEQSTSCIPVDMKGVMLE